MRQELDFVDRPEELAGNGVAFERYSDGGITTDENGIAVFGESKSAWFKDPDGNVIALVQP